MRHSNLARNAVRHDASGKLIDKSKRGGKKLARKGFRVCLESERSDKFKASTPNGKIEKFAMDVKTIGKTGKYTIKSTLEKASKQGSRAVVLMQGTKKMTRQYVERQISLFQQKSPKRARDKMEYVIVVGASGNVHRHKLK